MNNITKLIIIIFIFLTSLNLYSQKFEFVKQQSYTSFDSISLSNNDIIEFCSLSDNKLLSIYTYSVHFGKDMSPNEIIPYRPTTYLTIDIIDKESLNIVNYTSPKIKNKTAISCKLGDTLVFKYKYWNNDTLTMMFMVVNNRRSDHIAIAKLVKKGDSVEMVPNTLNNDTTIPFMTYFKINNFKEIEIGVIHHNNNLSHLNIFQFRYDSIKKELFMFQFTDTIYTMRVNLKSDTIILDTLHFYNKNDIMGYYDTNNIDVNFSKTLELENGNTLIVGCFYDENSIFHSATNCIIKKQKTFFFCFDVNMKLINYFSKESPTSDILITNNHSYFKHNDTIYNMINKIDGDFMFLEKYDLNGKFISMMHPNFSANQTKFVDTTFASKSDYFKSNYRTMPYIDEKGTWWIFSGINVHNRDFYEYYLYVANYNNYIGYPFPVQSEAFPVTTFNLARVLFDNNYIYVAYGYNDSNIATILKFKITDSTSIPEQFVNNINISPNPTNSDATLALDLQTAGNLKIILNDLLGQELLELHNNFEQTGIFTKTFSTSSLPKGIYYLKIFIGKDIKVEKLVVN